jgi:hypothetical protein
MPYIEISEKFYSSKKITIDRDNKDFPQTVSVQNANGQTIFTCNQSWTDEQIFKTVEIANHAFKLGQMKGAGEAFENIKNYVIEKKSSYNLTGE